LRDISAFRAVEMHSHDIALYKFSILFCSILLRARTRKVREWK